MPKPALRRRARWRGTWAVSWLPRRARSLSLSRSSGMRWWDGWALEGLGRVARTEGDLRAAGARHHEALVHCHRVGERPGVATALDALGGLATLDGDAVHAARLFGAAQAICDALGH